jgi:hypothetical protein
MKKLVAHHGRSAYGPTQHRLIDNRPNPGWLYPVVQFLALEAEFDPALDLVSKRSLVTESFDNPGVVSGLEKRWYELRVEAADGGGRLLLTPPSQLAGLRGKCREPGPCLAPAFHEWRGPLKIASDPAGRYQDAEREADAVIDTGNRSGLVSLKDVDQLRQPVAVVDGGAFRPVEAAGRQSQDSVRQVIEAVPDLFARHVADGCREQAAGDASKG